VSGKKRIAGKEGGRGGGREGGREGGRDAHDRFSGGREVLGAFHPRHVTDEPHGDMGPPMNDPVDRAHWLPAVREEGGWGVAVRRPLRDGREGGREGGHTYRPRGIGEGRRARPRRRRRRGCRRHWRNKKEGGREGRLDGCIWRRDRIGREGVGG